MKVAKKVEFSTKLKAGDPVIVIAGGNSNKPNRNIKGQTGKVKQILTKKNRIIVEGLNMAKRHKKAKTAQETSGIIEKEASLHISNVMFYNEELKRPVRVKFQQLEDGRKVRGFMHPETKKFEQIDV